ncbi:hypothetical protein Q668_17390 [Alcanivorax sp. PN-3]|nr:hypothetical protein Q668_17390 [Alcanivorax sp. PN-3]
MLLHSTQKTIFIIYLEGEEALLHGYWRSTDLLKLH